MMSRTHISFGVATSLLAAQPKTVSGCFVAVLGGSIGGIISDIDMRSNKYCRDALYGRLIVVGIIVITLFADWVFGFQILESILSFQRRLVVTIGAILLGVTFIFGTFTSHRTFTHSFLGLALMSTAIYMVCPTLFASFVIGFLSHILLDVINKKPVELLYPKKWGFCLGICYADKLADKVFMILSVASSLILLVYFLFIR